MHVCSLLMWVCVCVCLHSRQKLSSFGCDKIHGACNARHTTIRTKRNEIKWRKKNCDEQISSEVMSIIRPAAHRRSTVSRRKLGRENERTKWRKMTKPKLRNSVESAECRVEAAVVCRIWRRRRRARDEINVVWTYERRIENTEKAYEQKKI